mmetsp:Transcript_7296/g.22222  ORF Transcript_7296/g.22222 Transcript_7296/m.22222 type:complete len:191 (-) Transcript_7296:144-716(-)
MESIVSVLSGVVTARVEHNDKSVSLRTPRNFTVYHRAELPAISPAFYVRRIALYGSFSPSCLLLGLYYIDRLAHKDHRFLLNCNNVHRLLITAIMLACKYLEDTKISLNHFAVVGGVSQRELVQQEADMLRRLEFRLSISPDELNTYRRCLSEEFLHIGADKDRLRLHYYNVQQPAPQQTSQNQYCSTAV